MDLKARAAKLKTEIPAIFLALKEKETPAGAKLLAALTVAYALSLVDLVPDFIPVLGYLDDLLILPALVVLTVKRIPPEQMARCREQAAGLWKNGRPKKWYYALPIVAVWLLVGFVIARALLRR